MIIIIQPVPNRNLKLDRIRFISKIKLHLIRYRYMNGYKNPMCVKLLFFKTALALDKQLGVNVMNYFDPARFVEKYLQNTKRGNNFL